MNYSLKIFASFVLTKNIMVIFRKTVFSINFAIIIQELRGELRKFWFLWNSALFCKQVIFFSWRNSDQNKLENSYYISDMKIILVYLFSAVFCRNQLHISYLEENSRSISWTSLVEPNPMTLALRIRGMENPVFIKSDVKTWKDWVSISNYSREFFDFIVDGNSECLTITV